MIVRKTSVGDYPFVSRIYAQARDFMRATGNFGQWKDGYPAPEMIYRDIDAGRSHVCVHDNEITGVFYFGVEREPTYRKIDGQWLNDDPYGVVHRIATSRSVKGAGAFCLQWCFGQCKNLRIDTHRDNTPMRNLLSKLGFAYCGIIWMEDGDERLAFQKVDNVDMR